MIKCGCVGMYQCSECATPHTAESLARLAAIVPLTEAPLIVSCTTCHDTHQRWSAALERAVPCTACPVPCESCRSGAYCATKPCKCGCHIGRTGEDDDEDHFRRSEGASCNCGNSACQTCYRRIYDGEAAKRGAVQSEPLTKQQVPAVAKANIEKAIELLAATTALLMDNELSGASFLKAATFDLREGLEYMAFKYKKDLKDA